MADNLRHHIGKVFDDVERVHLRDAQAVIAKIGRIARLDSREHLGGEIAEQFRVGGREVELDALAGGEIDNLLVDQVLHHREVFGFLNNREGSLQRPQAAGEGSVLQLHPGLVRFRCRLRAAPRPCRAVARRKSLRLIFLRFISFVS